MAIREIEAKSILRKYKRIDSWFITRYGMNLYRGCLHNCVYCDGRAEKYNVEGEFGKDIAVKTNALELLRKELDPKRKRVPLSRCFIMLGGGVGDCYQPVEQNYKITRGVLGLLKEFNYPISILTKSTLVERDIDIIEEIHRHRRAVISFSFSSMDDDVSSVFEPGVPSPSQRLAALERIKKRGIPCGMFLLPVIPFITDTEKMIEASVKSAAETGLDFVIFGGMTLKEGRQKEHFISTLCKHFPDLVRDYQKIYPGIQGSRTVDWGQATGTYYRHLDSIFRKTVQKHPIPIRIPPRFYDDILSPNDLVMVMLEHLDFAYKLEGRESPFAYAAYTISKLAEPIAESRDKLRSLRGVGKTTEKIILDILETGTSPIYEKFVLRKA